MSDRAAARTQAGRQAGMQAADHSLTHSLTECGHSLTHSLTHSLCVCSFVRSFVGVRSFVRSFVRWFGFAVRSASFVRCRLLAHSRSLACLLAFTLLSRSHNSPKIRKSKTEKPANSEHKTATGTLTPSLPQSVSQSTAKTSKHQTILYLVSCIVLSVHSISHFPFSRRQPHSIYRASQKSADFSALLLLPHPQSTTAHYHISL